MGPTTKRLMEKHPLIYIALGNLVLATAAAIAFYFVTSGRYGLFIGGLTIGFLIGQMYEHGE